MREDSDLTRVEPVDVDSYEIRKMMMKLFVVPKRLVKLKRLVDILYSKGGNNV